AHTDAHIRSDAEAAQVMGQTVGLGIESRVVKRALFEARGYGVGIAPHLSLEQAVYTPVFGKGLLCIGMSEARPARGRFVDHQEPPSVSRLFL
ncbi:hypothetical protein PSYMO_14316, partial [Pseudomonas amygdali pv. mori str. 301020]